MSVFLLSSHALFGTKHLILIAVSFALIAALAFFARKLDFRTVCKLLFAVGIVSETIKIFYFTHTNEAQYGGVLPKTDLPFHLCSIQILFIAFVTLSKNEKLKRYVLSFMRPSCLFGGIFAILIATYSARNGGWIITTQYFGYHIALVVFALYLYTSKEVRFEIKDYYSCLIFLFVIMFVAFYVNSILYDGVSDINFMYVAGPPQDGLPYLNDDKGWLSYILRYAFLILVCITLSYIAPIVRAIKAKRKPKAAADENDGQQA